MPKLSLGRVTSSISFESEKAKTNDPDTESDDKPASNNTMQKQSHDDARDIRRKKLEALSASVKKPRRVLNQRSDNPLLRPIEWMAPTKLREETPKSRLKGDKKVIGERKAGSLSGSDEEDVESGAEEESDESDGMSDFIVDDDESLEEGDSEIEMTPPPPRYVRKLVRGRRTVKEEQSESEDLETKMRTLDITERDITKSNEHPSEEEVSPSKENNRQWGNLGGESKSTRKAVETKEAASEIDSETENQSPKPLLFETENNRKVKDGGETEVARFTTPPPSPKTKSRGLQSPKKVLHIPATPHRLSTDNFWRQDVINDWNDEYSPRKVPKIKPKSQESESEALSSHIKSEKNEGKMVRNAKKAFFARRDQIAREFLIELDEKLGKGLISKLTKDTGGVKINWNKKLMTTAGQAKWKRENLYSRPNIHGGEDTVYREFAIIELAEKVIDNEDRLLNVLAHEFCHLCTIMIDGVTDHPHGKAFKTWAATCSNMFRDRGIKVTTKHSYAIQYKYVWACSMCGLEFKRHSKSINPERHLCGGCQGTLEQIKPLPRPASPRKPSSYQMFVKDNMAKVREENPGSPQKDIMRLVGQRYQESKKQGDKPGDEPMVGSDSEVIVIDDGEDDSMEDTLEAEGDWEELILATGTPKSMKKHLEFIDLTDD